MEEIQRAAGVVEVGFTSACVGVDAVQCGEACAAMFQDLLEEENTRQHKLRRFGNYIQGFLRYVTLPRHGAHRRTSLRLRTRARGE